MKTAISIPDALFADVDRMAKRLGVSRSGVIRRAVEEFLRAHREEQITQALNEVYGPSGEKAQIDPVLARMQAASIPKEEW